MVYVAISLLLLSFFFLLHRQAVAFVEAAIYYKRCFGEHLEFNLAVTLRNLSSVLGSASWPSARPYLQTVSRGRFYHPLVYKPEGPTRSGQFTEQTALINFFFYYLPPLEYFIRYRESAVTFHIRGVLLCIRPEHLVIISRLVMPGCGCDPAPLGMNGTDGPGA